MSKPEQGTSVAPRRPTGRRLLSWGLASRLCRRMGRLAAPGSCSTGTAPKWSWRARPNAPKVIALQGGNPAAVTIDSAEWPYAELLVGGRVEVDEVDGIAPEYRAAALWYFGEEQGSAWCDELPPAVRMTRFRLQPEWVGVVDFDGMRRLPSALAG